MARVIFVLVPSMDCMAMFNPIHKCISDLLDGVEPLIQVISCLRKYEPPGFSRGECQTLTSNQDLCRNAQTSMQLPNHRQGQWALSVQNL